MSYQLTAGNTILRLSDNALIPNAPGNRDYAEYQAWVADGNTPLPYVPPGYEDLLTAKATRTGEINSEAHSLLAPSDWMAIRAGEGGDPIPTDWAAYRRGVRDRANTCVTRIDDASSIPEVQAIMPVWPTIPSD